MRGCHWLSFTQNRVTVLLSADFPCGDKAQAPAHTSLGRNDWAQSREQLQHHQLLPSPPHHPGGWPKPLAGAGGRLQAPVVLGGSRRFCFECLQPGWEFQRVAASMCGTEYFRGGSSLFPNGLCYHLTRKNHLYTFQPTPYSLHNTEREHREFHL